MKNKPAMLVTTFLVRQRALKPPRHEIPQERVMDTSVPLETSIQPLSRWRAFSMNLRRPRVSGVIYWRSNRNTRKEIVPHQVVRRDLRH